MILNKTISSCKSFKNPKLIIAEKRVITDTLKSSAIHIMCYSIIIANSLALSINHLFVAVDNIVKFKLKPQRG